MQTTNTKPIKKHQWILVLTAMPAAQQKGHGDQDRKLSYAL